nr:PREDICTED: uncharacterized protein LOC102208041 [Pundamilia nyererei]
MWGHPAATVQMPQVAAVMSPQAMLADSHARADRAPVPEVRGNPTPQIGSDLARGARPHQAASGSMRGTYLSAQPQTLRTTKGTTVPRGAMSPQSQEMLPFSLGWTVGLPPARQLQGWPSVPDPDQTANSSQPPAPIVYREWGCEDPTPYSARSYVLLMFGKSEVSHRCSSRCVSPLTFDSQAVGEKVRLSHGGRLAEKTDNTFKNGLVFSNRPVKIQEKICLRIEKDSSIWDGALRVGFTTVPPSTRSLPLPSMSIPNLTDKSGHWAVPLDESVCQAGSELEFWVSSHGSIYIGVNNEEYERLPGVDTKQPLWAMIDIYGQTRSILLLDSKKNKKLLYRRRSCPAPEPLASPDPDSHFRSVPDVSDFRREDCISCLDTKMPEDAFDAVHKNLISVTQEPQQI